MHTLNINILLQNTSNVTVANISDLRGYIKTKIPNAKVTWCPDNNFVFSGHKNDENVLIKSYLQLGDDLAMGDGFPALDHNLNDFKASVDEFFASSLVRFGKEPTVFTSWHCPALYMQYLEEKGIKILTGTVWSQTGVDRVTAEGSRLFPYYPCKTNFMVPAKNESSKINIVCCNSLSADPLGCRVLSGDSRWTLHPADPNPANSNIQNHILDQALLNNFYPLFVYPEVDWLYSNNEVLSNNFKLFIDHVATKNINVITMTDFDNYFRSKYPDNNNDFGMVFTGSGITYGNSTSDSNLKQYWYENLDTSICVQKDLTTGNLTIETCLDYQESQPEYYGYFNFNGTMYRDRSYKKGLSYKFDNYLISGSRYLWKIKEFFVDRAKNFFKNSDINDEPVLPSDTTPPVYVSEDFTSLLTQGTSGTSTITFNENIGTASASFRDLYTNEVVVGIESVTIDGSVITLHWNWTDLNVFEFYVSYVVTDIAGNETSGRSVGDYLIDPPA